VRFVADAHGFDRQRRHHAYATVFAAGAAGRGVERLLPLQLFTREVDGVDPGDAHLLQDHVCLYGEFPASARIVVVEVDPKTGEIALQQYSAVDDVGKVINPMIVEGQNLGGIAQGVGHALGSAPFMTTMGNSSAVRYSTTPCRAPMASP